MHPSHSIFIENSTPISCAVLPIDAFEAIIDQACDDTPSLRNLSLSCSTLQPRARYHLFRTIVIQTLQQIETSREFLDARPWLPPLVRIVVLSTVVPEFPVLPLSRNIRLLDVVPVYLLSRLPSLSMWKMGIKNRPVHYITWLSFHRSALSCYQKYGRCTTIQHLELSDIPFRNISDFARLVLAFGSMESLTCSLIRFPTALQDNLSQHPLDLTTVAQRLRLKRLSISSSVGLQAAGYLLASSANTLNSLVLTIDHSPVLQVERGYKEHLELLISQLCQLSSLAFVILPHGMLGFIGPGTIPDIRWLTRILGRVTRAPLEDLRVELKPNSLVRLGSPLSYGGDPLEACKALDRALLRIPLRRIVIHNPVLGRRAGRAEFWATAIKHAFPGLDKEGCLTFAHSKIDTPDPVGHETSVDTIVSSHDSKQIISISLDGTVIAWDTQSGTIAHEWLAHPEGFHEQGEYSDLALSPDSRRLLSVGVGRSETPLKVWDLTDRVRRAAAPEGYTDSGMISCAWSPDGALIASASAEGIVRIWDALTFQQRDVHQEVGYPRQKNLQFSPDARYLAWISQPRSIKIWSRSEDVPKRSLMRLNCNADVNAFAFNPQSTRLVTAQGWKRPETYIVRIWDIETGAVLALLKGHTAAVQHASFSPDGRSILSIQRGPGGLARIWDAVSWKETLSFETGGGSGCFSPCGQYIATWGTWGIPDSESVQLWRASDGLCLATFTEHKSFARCAVFSPNGEFLASGDNDGIVHIRRISNFV